MSDPKIQSYLLMSSARIVRTITRMAYQIFEDAKGSDQLVIFGVRERGYRLAVILSERLTEICRTPIRAYPIDRPVPGQKDADTGTALNATETSSGSEPSLKGKKAVIVNDVMYSGRTMYHALTQVISRDAPEEVRVAVLVDRGHRRYPIDVQYLGLYCPTKLREHVHCRFDEHQQPQGVWLDSSGNPEST